MHVQFNSLSYYAESFESITFVIFLFQVIKNCKSALSEKNGLLVILFTSFSTFRWLPVPKDEDEAQWLPFSQAWWHHRCSVPFSQTLLFLTSLYFETRQSFFFDFYFGEFLVWNCLPCQWVYKLFKKYSTVQIWVRYGVKASSCALLEGILNHKIRKNSEVGKVDCLLTDCNQISPGVCQLGKRLSCFM